MKIDWSKVKGWKSDMTDAEKIKFYEEYEPEENTGKNYKAEFDKASSELAAVKKQLKERMTEEEKASAEREAADKALREELEELRKERTISNHKASFLAQGYTEELATAAAKAMAENDMASVFEHMKTHAANLEKSIKEKIIKDTPRAGAGESKPAEESEAIKMAAKIGRTAAEDIKVYNSVISHYK